MADVDAEAKREGPHWVGRIGSMVRFFGDDGYTEDFWWSRHDVEPIDDIDGFEIVDGRAMRPARSDMLLHDAFPASPLPDGFVSVDVRLGEANPKELDKPLPE